MLSLARANRARGAAGDPLPAVFSGLADSGVHIRQGQLTLLAAAPGVGKSLMALTLALRADVTTLYLSADTDAATMFVRAGATLTGWTVGDVEAQVRAGLTEAADSALNAREGLRFCFDAGPSLDDVDGELLAYALAFGEWPRLIVVDNISNVWADVSDGGHQALDAICDYLHQLARKTNAAIVALHHVVGQYDDGTMPVPLSGLRGKISKVPETILTLHRGGTAWNGYTVNVSPVKNRTGKSDPSGNWFVPLAYEPERMRLE